jgi:hypothetical protein
MTTVVSPAKMTPMTDDRGERGLALQAAVKDRRAQGLRAAWLIKYTGISRTTYDNAIRGVASTSTYEALEGALADWDENPDDRQAAPPVASVDVVPGGLIEVELGGVASARFNADKLIVRSPAENIDELIEAVQKILSGVTEDE